MQRLEEPVHQPGEEFGRLQPSEAALLEHLPHMAL